MEKIINNDIQQIQEIVKNLQDTTSNINYHPMLHDLYQVKRHCQTIITKLHQEIKRFNVIIQANDQKIDFNDRKKISYQLTKRLRKLTLLINHVFQLQQVISYLINLIIKVTTNPEIEIEHHKLNYVQNVLTMLLKASER